MTILMHAGKLTDPVGRALAGFPVEPWMGKVLLAGVELGCSQEALILVAMAATDPVWLTPRSIMSWLHLAAFVPTQPH